MPSKYYFRQKELSGVTTDDISLKKENFRICFGRKLAISIISSILFSALVTDDLHAWHTLEHPFLSTTSLNCMPDDIKVAFIPYLEQIKWGSVAPDVTIKDWPYHEYNIHSYMGSKENGVERICSLYGSIKEMLISGSYNYYEISYQFGLISHYIADLCQPLHTDEIESEESFHVKYETDAYLRQESFTMESSGFRLIKDLRAYLKETVARSNRHYTGIAKAYTDGSGYTDAEGITAICMKLTVEAIRDICSSLWYESKRAAEEMEKSGECGSTVALHTDKIRYRHGETLNMTLSSSGCSESDIYIAMIAQNRNIWFLTQDGEFSRDMTPWKRGEISITEQSGRVEDKSAENDFENGGGYAALLKNDDSSSMLSSLSGGEMVMETLLWPQAGEGELTFIAAALSDPDMDLESNLSIITIEIAESEKFSLAGLGDETYIFPAVDQDKEVITPLALQRWDFILLGQRDDITASPGDESEHDNLIPGTYNHLMVYLGRDRNGTPYAMEMTTFFNADGYDLRTVRLPEFDHFDDDSEAVPTPVVSKTLWTHRARWALRLTDENLSSVKSREVELLQLLQKGWEEKTPYQFEFSWSGELTDTNVHLVDDGMAGGAGCTDYWLAFFEDNCGVCIRGSRMSAAEVSDYFRNDPTGREALIPDELNPFPFSLYVKDLFTLGFRVVDDSPHIFRCDGSEETGVPIPSRLIYSGQLENIPPASEVEEWLQKQDNR